MKVDCSLSATLEEIPERVQKLESLGYDGVFSVETSHDPFLPLVLAAEHSERVELMTSIAVAFSRNPMTVANLAHDLQSYSKGRFVLGLGSQIKPHITKRFSMPWSKPAARMREFVLAMRAIWANWYEGEPLRFQGEFYTHTLMTPMFTPTDTTYGVPKVIMAAVGPLMTRAAGEVADGMIAHSFTTRKYMEDVTLPAIIEGLRLSNRPRSDFQLSYPAFVVSGRDEEQTLASRTAVCKQVAFYGSTPAYRAVLEGHGWGELQDELNAMSKRGLWDEMGTRITDDILEEFAVVAKPGDVATQLKARYTGLIDRVTLGFGFLEEAQRPAAINSLRV